VLATRITPRSPGRARSGKNPEAEVMPELNGSVALACYRIAAAWNGGFGQSTNGGMNMRALKVLTAAALLAGAAALPALADDAMATMGMMKGGEVIAVMPDGHMGTMMVTDKMATDKMMGMAKPLDHCVMMMTGMDGKTYMVDTSSADAMAECEKMAK
jgi:hypothetical protein